MGSGQPRTDPLAAQAAIHIPDHQSANQRVSLCTVRWLSRTHGIEALLDRLSECGNNERLLNQARSRLGRKLVLAVAAHDDHGQSRTLGTEHDGELVAG